MGVTNIRRIENQTNYYVIVRNWETPHDTKSVDPDSTIDNMSMWIPWCDTEEDFVHGHRITVEWQEPVGTASGSADVGFVYSVFQSGDSVLWIWGDTWTTSWEPIEGESSVNGERVLTMVPAPGAKPPSPTFRLRMGKL